MVNYLSRPVSIVLLIESIGWLSLSELHDLFALELNNRYLFGFVHLYVLLDHDELAAQEYLLILWASLLL